MSAKIRWLPLESNPEVLNKYANDIGVSASWQFIDVYSLDTDVLATIPTPVIAVILLFPCPSDKTKKQDIGTLKEKSAAYFMKQTISNACGTVAMIHCLTNNAQHIKFDENKSFSKFLAATKLLTPEQRAAYLETDTAMGSAHGERANEGQTETPRIEDEVKCHFVALVQVDGELLQLDGSKSGPMFHGKTSSQTFLQDAVGVVKKFMERDPTEVNFTVMALVPA